MRGLIFGSFLVLLLMVPPTPAMGAYPLRMELDAAEVRISPNAILQTGSAAWRADIAPAKDLDHPSAEFNPATVTVTQYWRNSTVVLRPDTGDVVHRAWKEPAKETFSLRPEALSLFRPREGRDFTVLVPPSSLAEARLGPGSLLTTEEPGGSLVQPRALSHETALAEAMGARPPTSGWTDVEIKSLWSAEEIFILIDGWDLRLSDGSNHLMLRTGFETTFESDLAATEVYSFILLHVVNGLVEFPQEGTPWRGYVTDPYVTWNGPAFLREASGTMSVGLAAERVQQETLRIDGAFQSWFTFHGPAAAQPLTMRAQGQGSTGLSAFVAQAVPLSLPKAVGLGAPVLLGMLLMGGIGLRVVQAVGLTRTRATQRLESQTVAPPVVPAPVQPTNRIDAPAAPPVPAPETPKRPVHVDDFQKQLRENPLNSEARFQLGIALMRANKRLEGMHHLDRSFRLSPEALLRFLECPEYANVRQQPEIRSLLARFHREQHWKIWSSYA